MFKPSFRKIAARWAFTVFSERNSSREMSRLLLPSARRARMPVSRRVRLPPERRGPPFCPSSPGTTLENRLRTTLEERPLVLEIATWMACVRSPGVASSRR